jgi:glucosamine--fructose-6-phosphate aminotransferase (isomerizing)
MCGIYGFVAAGKRDASLVLEGLTYLEYRGYDSWGIAVQQEGAVAVEKAVGPIAGASTSLPSAAAALGHTRWATHGGVTHANAHPHTDCSGRLALIHNGIVENYRELGGSLQREHRFTSQTDTEVLAHLVEEELETESDLLQALLRVFRRVQGLSAVAVLDAASGVIAVAKNGSPLAIGWSPDATYLASDAMAMLNHTREVTFLEDGQAALLSPDGTEVVEIASGERIHPEVRTITADGDRGDLNGYDHFMIKEINEQPSVLRRIADQDNGVADLADAIDSARDIYLVGCGTAYHAAMSARYALAEIAGVRSTAVVASEMDLCLPSMDANTLVIAFSQSGETIDVLEAVRAARERGARIAAVVNSQGSALDRLADVSVHLGCGPERCVLATKSYTAKLAVMELVAGLLAGRGEEVRRGLRCAASRLDGLLAREQVEGAIRETAQDMADHQHLFILGRGRNYPLALEAALKIKEVSYMHAEGFASGELKHGVIALITNGTPCIVLAPDETYRREVLAGAAEVHARGATTIGLSPEPEAEFSITLPLSGGLGSAYEIAATTQLLAYDLARLRGCDPDRPRNLAKSVTVK